MGVCVKTCNANNSETCGKSLTGDLTHLRLRQGGEVCTHLRVKEVDDWDGLK